MLKKDNNFVMFEKNKWVKFNELEIINKKDYIEIILTDNGIGFSEKNLNNLTKPYFTTKQKGTGLGLSIVNKIISDHNGIINFYNKKNEAKVVINFKKNVD